MGVRDRYTGSMLGLAIGDALGTTLEFMRPGTFLPISGIVGGGPFNLKAGQWTDDTSMALCMAESLIECKGFDAKDQMDRYLRWYQNGYLSSTGVCFDIGNTTREALERYRRSGEPFSGSVDPGKAGNGSLMRLAPIPLFFAGSPTQAIRYCKESSQTTHGAREALDACRYYGGLIIGAIDGQPKDVLLSPMYEPNPGIWAEHPLAAGITEIAKGSYKAKNPPAIQGGGYVAKSLEAALWAFYNSATFAEGALLAVNLGDDADTTGAIYGQLAGAYYGLKGIPEDWIKVIAEKQYIETLASQIYDLSLHKD